MVTVDANMFDADAAHLQQQCILRAVPRTLADVNHQATTCAALQHLLSCSAVPHIGSHRLGRRVDATSVLAGACQWHDSHQGSCKHAD